MGSGQRVLQCGESRVHLNKLLCNVQCATFAAEIPAELADDVGLKEVAVRGRFSLQRLHAALPTVDPLLLADKCPQFRKTKSQVIGKLLLDTPDSWQQPFIFDASPKIDFRKRQLRIEEISVDRGSSSTRALLREILPLWSASFRPRRNSVYDLGPLGVPPTTSYPSGSGQGNSEGTPDIVSAYRFSCSVRFAPIRSILTYSKQGRAVVCRSSRFRRYSSTSSAENQWTCKRGFGWR